jgi:Holliday junction resolvase
MANPNGRKGSAWEIGILKWLRSHGVFAERLRLSGSKDEGDIVAVIAGKTYILEAKNRKSISLPTFWEEAVAEARGLAEVPPSFVVIKRRNASVEKAFVVQDLDSWLKERM